MQLYAIVFDDSVSPDSRLALADSLETHHWDVKRKWIPADSSSGNLIIHHLEITNWYEQDLPLPTLPSGCFLEKP